MNKVVKETRYCKVLRQAKIRDNNVAYGIEKIFVKELNQEEIRFVYFKDTFISFIKSSSGRSNGLATNCSSLLTVSLKYTNLISS